jgi:hypothetical protein
MDAAYATDDFKSPEGQEMVFRAWCAAEETVRRIDPNGAYEMQYGEPFGYAMIHREDPEGVYCGSAKGADAVRALLLQRDKYSADRCTVLGIDSWEEYETFRAAYRAKCDLVALACADGRFEGVCWG